MKGIKVLQANNAYKKENTKTNSNPKHLLKTEGSKFIEVDKKLVADLLYNKRIKEKNLDSLIDSSNNSEERSKLIEERKLVKKSVTIDKNTDGNLRIQIRKSIDIHTDTPQKEEGEDHISGTRSSNTATQLGHYRKDKPDDSEVLMDSESENDNVSFVRSKRGVSNMVLSEDEDEGKKRSTPEQENKQTSSDLTEQLTYLNTSPHKKQRSEENRDCQVEESQIETQNEMQIETKQNLDALFSQQEQIHEAGKIQFLELKNAGNIDDCPLDKLTAEEVKELVTKWESEKCEGGYLNMYEVKKHIKENRIAYLYASTYLATHHGPNGGIISDHIRETLSEQVEETEIIVPSAKEEQKKKRVKLELTDLRDFHVPRDDWPPLLTSDAVALNFTWTLKSSLVGMKTANVKVLDMEDETAKSIIRKGFAKEDTNQQLTGSQIARVLEEFLTEKEIGSTEMRLIAQLIYELNACLKWRQLPKGALTAILTSHEALQLTLDELLEPLRETVNADLVTQIATTLEVGNTIFGVLLRHYVSLATEINSVRLLCTLQRYASALLLHNGGHMLKFLELEKSINPDRINEQLVTKLSQVDTTSLTEEQSKVYEEMMGLLVTQRVEYETVLLNPKNMKLRLATASSLVVEDRIKMLNRPLTGNLVTVSKKDLLKQTIEKFPMLWTEVYAAGLAEPELGRRPTLAKLGKIARALAREAITYLELNWPSNSPDYKVDERGQQKRISMIYREMILDFLGNHSRYSQTDFLVKNAFKQTELKLLDAIERSNPNVKIRASELRPMILNMLDMTLSDLLTEPSGRLTHKLAAEAEYLIKQLDKLDLTLHMKDCTEEQWCLHETILKWQNKGEYILHKASATNTAMRDAEGLYWHPPEEDVLMLRPLIRPQMRGNTQLHLPQSSPLPKNLMSSNPLDHILARISRSELRTKHLVITYFTGSDTAKFRKLESQAVVIGRRAAIDQLETDNIPDGGVLATREQDLLSVRVTLASTLLFKMDGETDTLDDHREFYQVGTGEKTRNNTYLSQPVTEHEANLLQNSSPTPLFFVKGFTSDIHVVTAQVRALRQRVDLILWTEEIEETPVLLYLLSRRPFTINGTFIADFTLKVMMTDDISQATLKLLYEGMGFTNGGKTAYIECASYRLWLSREPVSIYELVPNHVTETKHHLTQLLLSSAHNAVTAIDILRKEPRSTSDKIIDVFTYKFAAVRYLMIKWNTPGQALTPTTIKAIAGQENTITQKVGLPAFTQLTQRNQKLTEYFEEKRRKSMQDNHYTPRRGEDRMVETQTPNPNPLLETRLGLLEQIIRNSEPASLRQLETTQQEMLARMDELTEVSNTVVHTRQEEKEEMNSRIERTERKLDTLTSELATTNQLLNDMLKHLGKPGQQTGQAAASSALRTQVVKPGTTTPAATGGPSGSSRRY